MVRTGSVKFSKSGLSIALVAEPLNHFKPTADEAKIAINTTPDTYSGVAEVTMEKVDNVRSVLDPSRIPAKIPMSSATGMVSSNAHNIRNPVRLSRFHMMSDAGSLKTDE